MEVSTELEYLRHPEGGVEDELTEQVNDESKLLEITVKARV